MTRPTTAAGVTAHHVRCGPPIVPCCSCPLQEKLKDKLGVKSTKASLLVSLGRLDEAQGLYRQLLDLNPDDYSVHEGLHRWAWIGPAGENAGQGGRLCWSCCVWHKVAGGDLSSRYQNTQRSCDDMQYLQRNSRLGLSSCCAVTCLCRRCLGITAPEQTQSWQQQQQQGGSGSSSSGGIWSPHSGKKRRVLHAYSADDRAKLVSLYQELCEAYPKSLACHRMPLDFLVSLAGRQQRQHQQQQRQQPQRQCPKTAHTGWLQQQGTVFHWQQHHW